MNEIATLIILVYNVLVIGDVLLLAFVITQARDDLHLSRTDPVGVSRERRRSFAVGSFFLLMTGFFQDYWLIHPTTIGVGLLAVGFIGTSAYILSVSSISMRLRAPPSNQSGFHAETAAHSRWRRTSL